MNPFNPLASRKKLGLMTDRASDTEALGSISSRPEMAGPPSELESIMSKLKSDLKEPSMTGGFESKPYSVMTPEEPKKYSLGADTDLKKAMEESDTSSGELGSAAIKASGQALGTVAKEAAANKAMQSKIGQETAIEAGRASRQARERGGRGTHNALTQLIASFRSATQ